MLKRSRKSGFTLLELLIVVIIVSILAAVALPRFGKMTRRSRGAEATVAIGAVLTAETLYYQEFGVFNNTLGNLMVELNTVNFSYALTTATTTARVVATGQSAAATGITVTGTVDSLGGRSIISN